MSGDMVEILLTGLKVLDRLSEDSESRKNNMQYTGGTIIPHYPQYERPEPPSVSLDLAGSDFSNCGEVNINFTVNYCYK